MEKEKKGARFLFLAHYNFTCARKHGRQTISERNKIRARAYAISTANFAFNFNGFGDSDCLLNFTFVKAYILELTSARAWPLFKVRAERSGYRVEQVLLTCIVLRRLATSVKWIDLYLIFGKLGSALSDIFWEALEHMMQCHGNRPLMSVNEDLWKSRAATYAAAVHNKCEALPNYMGFIDGNGIRIARPKG